MLTPLDRMRLQRGAEHLHTLGPRAVAELLAEVAQSIGGTPCILDRLQKYERLRPAVVRATGGDRFPPGPVRPVPR